MKVSKSFLESILLTPIVDYSLSQGAKPGDNVLGSLESIRVTLPSDEVLQLVNKTVPDDPEFRSYAIQSQMFLVEKTMYDTIGPSVASLLLAKGVPASKASLPLPKYIAGDGLSDIQDQYLCLQDVRPEGFIMSDKYSGYDLPEMELILKELARFHASTYFWLKHEGEKIFDSHPGLEKYRSSLFTFQNFDPVMDKVASAMFQQNLENAGTILKESGNPDLAERVEGITSRGSRVAMDILEARSKRTDRSTFPCILHGDLWVNNIMIKYTEGKPVALKFLDFQQGRRGNIYEELIYFIYTSTTPEFRSHHLLHVLNVYYEAFEQMMGAIGAPLPVGFTRGVLIDTFYEEILSGYVYIAFAIPLQLVDVEEEKKKEEENKKDEGGDGGPPPEVPLDAMIEMLVKKITGEMIGRKEQMIRSPRAIQRLVDITREMVNLKIF